MSNFKTMVKAFFFLLSTQQSIFQKRYSINAYSRKKKKTHSHLLLPRRNSVYLYKLTFKDESLEQKALEELAFKHRLKE